MKVNPFRFLHQVREEMARVTWPTRQETVATLWFVVLMSGAAALFFLLADRIILALISWILGLGGRV
jgi:preprotein translocase subunit SecE